VIAAGTPTELKDSAGQASVVLTVSDAADLPRAAELMRTCSAEVHVEEAARRLVAQADGLAAMSRIGHVFAESGIAVDDLGLKRPSLDDVFLKLTGRDLREGDDPPASTTETAAVAAASTTTPSSTPTSTPTGA
jgi:ABC-2 type transport system ATP-binding protein